MRWRVEKEVVEGKGQFICANKKCDERKDLASWEVNFAYLEDGQKKNALVKLRLCPKCSDKLNYHQKYTFCTIFCILFSRLKNIVAIYSIFFLHFI